MKPIINFIFPLGARCYSLGFLLKFNLRKMSCPLDALYIDLETSLKIIDSKFADYLHDIVLFNRNAQKLELFYKKNTTEIKPNFYGLLENNIGYMAHNYNGHDLLFNQNYVDDEKLPDNLYNWKTLCCFFHHNILDGAMYQSVKYRCERFNHIMNKYNDTTVLFYISKIVHCENIAEYMNNIIQMKYKYRINGFMILIINCDNLKDSHYYNEIVKCLFIIKHVEDYNTQYAKTQTDNDLDYEKEFNIIKTYFDIELIEKNDI